MRSRCKLCGIPTDDSGQLDFCSSRCMHWHFHGIPALKKRDLTRERVLNLRKENGERHSPGPAYDLRAPWKMTEPRITEITASYYIRDEKLNGEES